MTKNIVVSAIVALAVVLGLSFAGGGQSNNNLAGLSSADTSVVSLKVGSQGTRHSKLISGTCNAQQKTPGSFLASSSAQFFCAVTGAVSGDKVFMSAPVGAGANANGSGSIYGGFLPQSGNATSTNWIQFSVYNATGAATSSFVQATTSWQYWILRN